MTTGGWNPYAYATNHIHITTEGWKLFMSWPDDDWIACAVLK